MRVNFQRRKLVLLLLCFFFSVSAIVLLDLVSLSRNHQSNAFIRLMPPHVLVPLKNKYLGYNSFYFAGATASKIYLANTMAPAIMTTTDSALGPLKQTSIRFPANPKIVQGVNMVVADSPYLYFMEGHIPLLMRGDLSNLAIDEIRTSPYFTESVPISPTSFIIRTFDPAKQQNVLAKAILGQTQAKEGANTLDKQIDGIFSTDGMLNYDPTTSRIIYIYFYRNQILCFDTALNRIYVKRTIDTVSHAQIALGEIFSQSSITMSKPPLNVNLRSCAADGLLYVQSGLKADNEDQETFDRCSVIDVYGIADGDYRFSFYIPNFINKKMKSFRVFGHTLLVIYQDWLFEYRINFPEIARHEKKDGQG